MHHSLSTCRFMVLVLDCILITSCTLLPVMLFTSYYASSIPVDLMVMLVMFIFLHSYISWDLFGISSGVYRICKPLLTLR